MKFNNIQSCHLGPEISPEQFIPEHFFLYLLTGAMVAYDGQKNYNMEPGDYCIARKNHLVRYTKYKHDGHFEKIIITFDEPFIRDFLQRHPTAVTPAETHDSFIFPGESKLIEHFIESLKPYYDGSEQIDAYFADIKREELLLILLRCDPRISAILFNFNVPHKIDLEEFMLRNYRFNVSTSRFAFLTGRSLSAFKRDFKAIFNDTPNRWLVRKRLEEAHFLIQDQGKKPIDIYAELGFENPSHFSYAFKRAFGKTPTELAAKQK